MTIDYRIQFFAVIHGHDSHDTGPSAGIPGSIRFNQVQSGSCMIIVIIIIIMIIVVIIIIIVVVVIIIIMIIVVVIIIIITIIIIIWLVDLTMLKNII